MTFQSQRTIVIGEGLSAAAAVWGCLKQEIPVQWVSPSGVSAIPVLGTIEQGAGVEVALGLAEALGFQVGPATSGTFIREFRNKGFRAPPWAKEQDPVERTAIGRAELWEGECWLGGFNEVELGIPLSEIERRLLEEIAARSEGSPLWRVSGVPVESFVIEGGRVTGVALGSGDVLACDHVIYADRFGALAKIQGVPKTTPWLRRRHPIGLLQAAFRHRRAWLQAAGQGFFTALHRESGEERERHVWGHFSANGMESYWTVALTPEEGEDNAMIAKRLRRAKTAIEKMFSGPEWTATEEGGFLGTIQDERVSYVEEASVRDGEPRLHGWRLPGLEGFIALTDSFGPGAGLASVGDLLGLPRSQGHRPEVQGIRVGLDVQQLLDQSAGETQRSP